MKDKILTKAQVIEQLEKERHWGQPITLVTGCFDILHRGHVELLETAVQAYPAHMVWLGLNSDEAVRTLKGPHRPINDFMSRATVMAGLMNVHQVFEIDSVRVTEAINLVTPHVWVKGGDYTLDTLDQDERKAADLVGARILLVPTVPGHSTTITLHKLERAKDSC